MFACSILNESLAARIPPLRLLLLVWLTRKKEEQLFPAVLADSFPEHIRRCKDNLFYFYRLLNVSEF